jgi:ketosteroid isomerase-like protein
MSSVNDREVIERRRTEYVEAFNREDIVAMTGYAAPDAVGMAPNRPAIRGIEAHRQFWREGFAAARSLFFVFPEELEVLGDVAIDQHKWVLDSMPKRGGRPIHDEGKGIWIWRRQMDGSWKVARGIWNSDLSRVGFQTGSNTELTEDLALLNKLLDDFVITVNAGDAHGWGQLMTEDFIFAVPDAPRFVGRDNAVAAAKMGFFDPFVLKLANKFEDVQIFGQQAFAHGIFHLDMIPRAGGKTMSLPGKFTNFFRKQADGWKYALVIFSYDHAPTTA